MKVKDYITKDDFTIETNIVTIDVDLLLEFVEENRDVFDRFLATKLTK